jgi:hypothetical protein
MEAFGWFLLGAMFALCVGLPAYRAWVKSRTPELRALLLPAHIEARPEQTEEPAETRANAA